MCAMSGTKRSSPARRIPAAAPMRPIDTNGSRHAPSACVEPTTGKHLLPGAHSKPAQQCAGFFFLEVELHALVHRVAIQQIDPLLRDAETLAVPVQIMGDGA